MWRSIIVTNAVVILRKEYVDVDSSFVFFACTFHGFAAITLQFLSGKNDGSPKYYTSDGIFVNESKIEFYVKN